ncbi:magnesium transporter CorA family protein [Patescibacteria group bacterium]|nr:magnesium transporter CorA family protein [Patescibacteria group bacterium]MDL1953199.1 magnesium transporter CorA family protein [Candidatus Uhrbacteria bacterium UHB]RIL00347.1 MAG: hypothetical protein DCC77_02140 [Candidatus Uhrbacteria bacterium]
MPGGNRLESVKTDQLEWFHATSNKAEVIDKLRTKFRFHPIDLRDVQPPIQRPKVVARDGYIFMILLYPFFDKDTHEIRISEVDFFISKNYLVTVNTDGLTPLRKLFQSSRASKGRHVCLTGDITQLLYAILNDLLTSVFPKLVNINADMESIERRLNDPYQKHLINDILRIKLNVVNFRQAMQAHKAVMTRLLDIAPSFFPLNKLNAYFRELIQHTKEIWDQLELQRDEIEALHETNKSLIDFRTNDIIKTLTIFSVIVFPLTLLAAMFGMNVPVPFQDHAYGFLIITGIMLLGSAGMMVYFKIKKWI